MLKHALARGEISAWFQPQIDVRTGRIVAAELLCRWHQREVGIIPPNEFIPVAEEDGVIAEIGQYMVRQAVALLPKWDIDLSVNVSPIQLETSSFTSWLESLLRRVPRLARRLTVEITEGRHLDHAAATAARLDRLRALGVGVAIDDFGAGQASITQLKRLHATELKIDRTLVSDDAPAAVRVLDEAIAHAHAAGIRVVAEGIETRAQLEKVTRMGCDRAQGYLLGHPVPRHEMTAMLPAG